MNLFLLIANYANGSTVKFDNNRLKMLNEGAIKPVIQLFVANRQINNYISIAQSTKKNYYF